MSNKTALTHDDAEIVNEMIDGLIESHPSADKRELQCALIDRLHTLASAGDGWADTVILALAKDGCGGRIHARLKSDRGTIRIADTGAIISLPTRFGVPAINQDGQREKHFQQPLWWELTWDRFEQLINSLIRQTHVLSGEITALHEILGLRDRFPDSASPGEACEMAGIDPRSFALEAA